ncbi:MAG TPA: NAD(P)-dependent alcohol dehydrogenase [Gemmatales bacterium]|nr:NAD(P)-dependent alcohol dehydrogenase [Gemmatales bacterium]HMP60133.1 NAD(P)-dependent alcohol dehydrogenase [Gemmatales bacterium]
MKACVIQERFGLDALTWVERPESSPGPGTVLVQMRAWSLNYRDLLVVKGQYNPKLKLPFTPLSDGVGQVLAVGPGVTRWQVGDRVAAHFAPGWVDGELTAAAARTALGEGQPGLLAEQVVLPEAGLVAVPSHLSDAEAATLPCAALTAWSALVRHGQVKAGDQVLIQGTGGVALFALQFAKLHGARVIATSSSDEKLDRVRKLGADAGVNYKTTPDWGDVVRKLAGGEGVDHIVEVGGAGTMAQSLRAIRFNGSIHLIGILAGAAAQFSPLPVLMKNVRVQGIFVGPRSAFEQMNRAIADHRLRPVLDRSFPALEVAAALAHMESGQHFGKIVLQW